MDFNKFYSIYNVGNYTYNEFLKFKYFKFGKKVVY